MSTSSKTVIYPCDRGTGVAMGYHHYQASPNGIVVCVYCGKRGDR